MVDNILNYKQNPGDDYYAILGCDELSTPEQICTEYKCRVLSCHPDKNSDNPNAAAQFSKLQKAKDILCNAESKGQYDLWRRTGIAIPFEEWLSRKAFTSIHWVNEERKKPMLTEKLETECKQGKTDALNWKSDQSDIVQKFRSYNI